MSTGTPQNSEPFLTPAERKTTVLFRPSEWREWWRREPLITKLVAVLCVLFLGFGAFSYRKDPDLGLIWLILGSSLLTLVLVYSLGHVLVASTRWSLKRAGLHSAALNAWRSFVTLVKVLFWIGFAVGLVAMAWPYLSWSPTKSWYAFSNSVPVDRVEIQKEPHDCEFETAPLGSKHCHYDAKTYVLKGADTPDGQKSLLVTYEKVED